MKKKTIVIASVVLGVLMVVGVIGTGAVLAAGNDSYPPIIKKLAEKLNVKESDVQGAFDEMRAERQKEMKANLEERLDEAVKDGKITEAQKEAILKKMDEVRSEGEKHREEMRKWAEENGIDPEIMHGLRGRPGGPPGGCFGPKFR